MQHHRSQIEKLGRGLPRRPATLAATLLGPLMLAACATGVDVSDDELAEICAESGTNCGSAGSRSIGGGSGGTGGSFANNAGSTGLGRAGSAGTSSNVGRGGSGVGSGGSSTIGRAGSPGGGAAGSPPISGGSCQSIVAPVATGVCAASGGTVAITYSDTGAGATNQIKMKLALANTGSDFNLNDLTIRYWFTANGESNFTGDIDYATLTGGADMKGSMCVAFGDQRGSQFADVAFTGGGSVGSTGIREVQLRIHTQNYAELDQSDDFSYSAGATNAPNLNLAVYLAGRLVAGCEPP
jgi:hypothetical protein